MKADPETGVSKYYVQGVRESGAEINVGTDAVTEDKDYVVSYGVRGSMAYYTVNYVDQQGNTLFPSQRYSGKVGLCRGGLSVCGGLSALRLQLR